eukprot:10218407-Alexandrium_andersonii.AAC.1
MSASLVGSEMCIRDSLRGPRRLNGRPVRLHPRQNSTVTVCRRGRVAPRSRNSVHLCAGANVPRADRHA